MRIGIDLGGTKIEIVAIDSAGTVLVRRRIATPAHDYAATIAAIGALVEAVEAEVGQASVGIGTPGSTSRHTGLIRNANSTVLNGRALRADLELRLGRAIRMENDANAFALSEATDGAGSGVNCVFGVILGTGVGGGIVVDGALLSGENAIAGEWGHTPLPWPRDDERPGPACYCGKFGCIETFLSGPAFARDHVAAGNRAASVPEIVQAARAGDAGAAATFARYLDRLARSLAVVITLLDPNVIVLGGGVSNARELITALPESLPAYVFSDALTTRIVAAQHGDSSGVRGAAWLWPST